MPKSTKKHGPMLERITAVDGERAVYENAMQLVEGYGEYFDRWLDSMRFAYREGRISLRCLDACESKKKGGD